MRLSKLVILILPRWIAALALLATIDHRGGCPLLLLRILTARPRPSSSLQYCKPARAGAALLALAAPCAARHTHTRTHHPRAQRPADYGGAVLAMQPRAASSWNHGHEAWAWHWRWLPPATRAADDLPSASPWHPAPSGLAAASSAPPAAVECPGELVLSTDMALRFARTEARREARRRARKDPVPLGNKCHVLPVLAS